jgi:hypothetical protein
MSHTGKLLVIVMCYVVLGLVALPQHAFAGRLVLAPSLATELNLILRASDVLHQSLVNQNEEQIEMGLRDVIWQIDRTKSSLHMAKPHERGHLVRILDAARDHFEVTQTAFGDDRRASLAEGYNQLVNLIRIYRLDRSYDIYFCPKDRTTWVQKGSRVQNPFRTDSQRQPCGIRVPK